MHRYACASCLPMSSATCGVARDSSAKRQTQEESRTVADAGGCLHAKDQCAQALELSYSTVKG